MPNSPAKRQVTRPQHHERDICAIDTRVGRSSVGATGIDNMELVGNLPGPYMACERGVVERVNCARASTEQHHMGRNVERMLPHGFPTRSGELFVQTTNRIAGHPKNCRLIFIEIHQAHRPISGNRQGRSDCRYPNSMFG
jgi:hypothetical protein